MGGLPPDANNGHLRPEPRSVDAGGQKISRDCRRPEIGFPEPPSQNHLLIHADYSKAVNTDSLLPPPSSMADWWSGSLRRTPSLNILRPLRWKTAFGRNS